MATAPVTPAPTETGLQKFESILTGINAFFLKAVNAEINIGTAEKPLIDQFLPTQFSSAIDTANAVALNTFLQVEAQEQALAGSSSSYASKVAQVLAWQGGAIAKVLASAGLESGQTALTALVTGATSFTQINKVTTLAATPSVAPEA